MRYSGRKPTTTLECHQCRVICERVVYPWRCLKGRQPCIYAFEDDGGTYFGCVHKVFSPEFDLEAFRGESVEGVGRSDPYGPVRVVRQPRSQCPVSVERAYCYDSPRERCVNVAFLKEVFRVVSGPSSEGPVSS